MDVVSTLTEVWTAETRGGNVRYVARDADGNEYTTFRDAIGEQAKALKGTRVRISFHEEQRGPYKNVYLDKLEQVESAAEPAGHTEAQEAAWRTAVEAAPWLVGEPRGEVEPDELYEKLKPFEERVASDIQQHAAEETDED